MARTRGKLIDENLLPNLEDNPFALSAGKLVKRVGKEGDRGDLISKMTSQEPAPSGAGPLRSKQVSDTSRQKKKYKKKSRKGVDTKKITARKGVSKALIEEDRLNRIRAGQGAPLLQGFRESGGIEVFMDDKRLAALERTRKAKPKGPHETQRTYSKGQRGGGSQGA